MSYEHVNPIKLKEKARLQPKRTFSRQASMQSLQFDAEDKDVQIDPDQEWFETAAQFTQVVLSDM